MFFLYRRVFFRMFVLYFRVFLYRQGLALDGVVSFGQQNGGRRRNKGWRLEGVGYWVVLLVYRRLQVFVLVFFFEIVIRGVRIGVFGLVRQWIGNKRGEQGFRYQVLAGEFLFFVGTIWCLVFSLEVVYRGGGGSLVLVR